jgi:hypothetical protein
MNTAHQKLRAGQTFPYWRRYPHARTNPAGTLSEKHTHSDTAGFCLSRSILGCRLPVAELSLIHHHKPIACGKQPKHPQKIAYFMPIFADHF